MPASSCTGLSCYAISTGEPVNPPVSVQGPDASTQALPLLKVACGDGSCVPDDQRACDDYQPEPTSSSGEADAGGSSNSPTRDAGDSLDAGLSDAGTDLAVDGSLPRPSPPELAPSAYACQMRPATKGRVARSCGPSGSRGTNEACTSSLDCEPGLGCVGSARSGRCLPYCCGIDGDSCQEGYYCAQRPLRTPELGDQNGPMVPVCDRADNCSLGEPADCLGEHCVCAAETACAMVRPDGTTACVRGGEGEAGDACPCQWGFTCSMGLNPPRCVKTCEVSDTSSCVPGVCQAAEELPQGWGTCVGAREAMP
ncbi:MAG: hypothetical protein RL685_5914 [Pseudomonadota bacterium]